MIARDNSESHLRVRRVVCRSLPFVVGQGPDAGLQLNDQAVENLHCTIDESDGGLVVRDLCTQAGTQLNGSRISESLLRAGDRVQIGNCVLQIDYDLKANGNHQRTVVLDVVEEPV